MLPIDIVHIILEYEGRIIFKNGKYIIINKIPIEDKIYDSIKQNCKIKRNIIRHIHSPENNKFYSDYFDNKKFIGIIRDYNYNGDKFIISFYKDTKQKFCNLLFILLNKFLNIYDPEDENEYYTITNYEYK